LVAMIPGDWGIKAVGILMIAMGIQQQIMRFISNTKLVPKKDVPPVA